eukprot:g19319.t1
MSGKRKIDNVDYLNMTDDAAHGSDAAAAPDIGHAEIAGWRCLSSELEFIYTIIQNIRTSKCNPLRNQGSLINTQELDASCES